MAGVDRRPPTRAAPAPRRALRRGLRVAECLLALGGAACLLAYGASCARSSHTQSVQSERFEQALRAQLLREAPDTSEWSAGRVAAYRAALAGPVDALGRLEIPDADVSVMVLEGTGETVLDRAVGRIEGTARPGEGGNLGIAGHRDGFFRGLRHLERGDPMRLVTLDGTAHYEVERIDIVLPKHVEVLAPSDEPVITLVTCYPFYYLGDAPKRYIVRARQVKFEPWTRDGSVQASLGR